MKKITLAFATFSWIIPVAHAFDLNDDFSLDTTFSLLSQYRARGVSQTQNDPAVQFDGMLTSKKTGLYLGAWTSNVDFGYGSKTRQELDYYVGWYAPFNDDIGLDLGYIKYTYPRESGRNYTETYGILTAYGFKAAAQYSNDYMFLDTKQSTLYTWIGYEAAIPYGFNLLTRYGRMDYKDQIFYSKDGSTRDAYHEWEVKVSREFLGLKWALSYVDSDLSKSECYNALGFDDACSATAVASVSKKF